MCIIVAVCNVTLVWSGRFNLEIVRVLDAAQYRVLLPLGLFPLGLLPLIRGKSCVLGVDVKTSLEKIPLARQVFAESIAASAEMQRTEKYVMPLTARKESKEMNEKEPR